MESPSKRTIESITDLQQDLSSRYKSVSAGNACDDDALKTRLADDLVSLNEQGYVVIENLLPPELVEEVRKSTVVLLDKQGRNNFEGLKTERVYNVLEKTRVMDALAVHPRVTGLLDRLFLPSYLLSQAQVINILPGEAAQPLHYDDGFYRVPRPRPPLGAAAIWAIDDFTADNGATLVIPESHKLGPEIVTDRSESIPVIMPAGSVVIFVGTLWHGGGENRSNEPRLAVTCQYCEPWLRPQENFFLELSIGTLSQLPDALLSMVGYSIHPPFMGMVDGMHPRRSLAEQMHQVDE